MFVATTGFHDGRNMGGFPKLRGTILRIPIIRTIVFWGLYWGPLTLGIYHIVYPDLEIYACKNEFRRVGALFIRQKHRGSKKNWAQRHRLRISTVLGLKALIRLSLEVSGTVEQSATSIKPQEGVCHTSLRGSQLLLRDKRH